MNDFTIQSKVNQSKNGAKDEQDGTSETGTQIVDGVRRVLVSPAFDGGADLLVVLVAIVVVLVDHLNFHLQWMSL